MKIATVKQFRDKATIFLKEESPLLITRRGKIAGLYMPFETDCLPLEFAKELQLVIASFVHNKLKKKGLHEEEVLKDFEKHRNSRR